MQVLLNIVGFSAFWLPPSCGERMGLSITAMLAAVAAEIVVAANLPQAAEYTWFQKFSFMSMIFAFVSLLESVVVLCFYYKRSEDVVPRWFSKFREWYVFRQMHKQGRAVAHTIERRASDLVDETSDRLHKSATGVRKTISSKLSTSEHDPTHHDEDFFSENQKKKTNGPTLRVLSQEDFEHYSFDDKGSEDKQEEKNGNDTSPTESDKSPKDPTKKGGNALDESGKSIELADFSQRNFGVFDTDEEDFGGIDIDGHISTWMMSGISFDGDLRASLQPKKPGQGNIDKNTPSSSEIDNIRAPSQPMKTTGSSRGQESNDKPSQGNFDKMRSVKFAGVSEQKSNTSHPRQRQSTLSHEALDDSRMKFMQSAKQNDLMRSMFIYPRDADAFNTEEEVMCNKKWKETAARIDDIARFWIPLAFFFALAVILAEAF